jgi:hypothetical protein
MKLHKKIVMACMSGCFGVVTAGSDAGLHHSDLWTTGASDAWTAGSGVRKRTYDEMVGAPVIDGDNIYARSGSAESDEARKQRIAYGYMHRYKKASARE